LQADGPSLEKTRERNPTMTRLSRWATIAAVILVACSPKLLLWYHHFDSYLLYLWGGKH
jgi:hypothetical protein